MKRRHANVENTALSAKRSLPTESRSSISVPTSMASLAQKLAPKRRTQVCVSLGRSQGKSGRVAPMRSTEQEETETCWFSTAREPDGRAAMVATRMRPTAGRIPRNVANAITMRHGSQ